MFVVKLFKGLLLFLISVVIMTIILFLTGALCLLFEIFNEYIFCCFIGVIHSIILLVSKHKVLNKTKIPVNLYLIFTTLIPAILFSACYIFVRNSNITASILDINISSIMYYFIFISFAFWVATIAITLIESLRLLINSTVKKSN